jgi:hypothetical protein
VYEAQRGNPAGLPRIKEILDQNEAAWRRLGDLGGLAERAWIDVLSLKNPVVAESLSRTLAAMRLELGGETPSPIEKLLVDQIVVSWLEVNCFELEGAAQANGSAKSLSKGNARLESAQRRYLAGMKMITDIRRQAPGALTSAGKLKIFEKGQASA